MKEREFDLKPGAVVQLNPDLQGALNDKLFAGCLMVVTEPKDFGAQGYILMPQKKGRWPMAAYYRAKWEEMEFIGNAYWVFK